MEWERPRYSRKSVRRAGDVLAVEPYPEIKWEGGRIVNLDDFWRHFNARLIFNNWRSAHAYPLNALHITLRARAKRVDAYALTAQRLKREPSIVSKLKRFKKMDLARMQDIGGCRAVVRDVQAAYALRDLFSHGRSRHTLESVDDYILEPKADGYRGIHLVYKYEGRGSSSTYTGLRVEIQLRTQIQHAWATAVETVGVFRREAMKSGQGDARWREFFCAVSEAFSYLEHGGDVPIEVPPGLLTQVGALALELDVVNRLEHYSQALSLVERGGGSSLYLLELDFLKDQLTVRGFKPGERNIAQQEYVAAEKLLDEGGDVVLVSVENIITLRKAFPNYFADTSLFVSALKALL